jgi:hypothetical protein
VASLLNCHLHSAYVLLLQRIHSTLPEGVECYSVFVVVEQRVAEGNGNSFGLPG